jgi:hypothetical protein
MLKHRKQYGNAALRPSNELAQVGRAWHRCGPQLRPQLAMNNMHEMKGGGRTGRSHPHAEIEVANKNIEEREARGGHRRR